MRTLTPIIKPPYATIKAIDMNKGEILWQQANGGAAPITYSVNGKQYVALSVLSNPVPELLVFALP